MTSAREVVESLTGFEEDRIQEMTGYTVDDLAAGLQLPGGRRSIMDIKLIRGLSAVLLMRSNPDLSTAEAWNQIQGRKQSDLGDLFEDEPDDVMPDDPDSAVGKDDSEPQSEPTSSPASVSQPA